MIQHPYTKKVKMGRKEDVKDISKKKKRPKKKCRDEDDKLRLELRKGVSKLSLLSDDFDCKYN